MPFADHRLFKIIHSVTQILTLSGSPQRRDAPGTLGIIQNGAVLFREEKIMAVGPTAVLRAACPNQPGPDFWQRLN